MPSILLGTKKQRKLLSYLFAHPKEDFYVRQLAVILNENPGNLSRELKRFENDGLCISKEKGNIKTYLLNENYPIYKELKSIISKTEGVEGALRALVGQIKGISYACIYGSYAKGRENEKSDIDLIVVGEFEKNDFLHKIRVMEGDIGREINYNAYTGKEFKKEKEKKGSFLNIVMKGKTIVLKDINHGK